MPFAGDAEQPIARRPVDAVRLVFAFAVCVVLTRIARSSSPLERALFDSVNQLPSGLDPLADGLTDVASLWTAGLVATASLWARRWRLAGDMVLAAVLAWMAARAVGLVMDTGVRAGLHAALHSRASGEFPDVPLAVMTAVVAVASPFLTRPTRWLARVAVALVIPAEMFSGNAMPRSLACAVAIGAAAAALVHLAFGSPAGRPTVDQVEEALKELGVLAVRDVQVAAVQQPGCLVMLAEDATSRLVVKVLGRDDRDARLVAKLWRLLWYRDSGLPLFLTRVQEIEHQAYVMLAAERAGVRIAPLIAAGTAGPGAAVLAERRLDGTPLAELSGDEISDDLLTDVWVQVTQLHHATIAHGRLSPSRVMVLDDAATLIGFDQAVAGADASARARDVAELLAVTSSLVGNARAVRTALQVVEPEVLALALPLLQTPVLSRESRRYVGLGRRELTEHLGELRELTAGELGEQAPELEQMTRLTASALLLSFGLVATLIGLLVAVGSPSELAKALSRARPWPLVDAALLMAASTLGFAMALAGSTRYRLPLGSNLAVQWAALFGNVALPLGGQAIQIRYLQRRGVPTAEAVGAGGLVNLTGGFIGQFLVFAIALATSPRTVTLVHIPQGTVTVLIEATTAGLLLFAVLVLALPSARKKLWRPVRRSFGALTATLRSPRHLLLLVGGSALGYLFMGLVLEAVLQAFDQGIAVSEALTVAIGIGLLAQIVPVPGGVGAVSAVGLSGALISLGVPHGVAVATALIDQVITGYLPVLPGYFASRWLMARGEL